MLTERQTGNEDRVYRTKKKEYSGLRWEIEGGEGSLIKDIG